MWELISAFILGIVEGVAEFLPISSTGHLIMVAHLLKFDGPSAKTFEIFIQLGAIFAVIILYFKQYLSLLNFKKKNGINLVHVILGMVPAIVIGLLFHDFIKDVLFSYKTVVYSLILGAILMIYADRKSKAPTTFSLDELTYKQAFGIGLFQVLSLYPGFSRSGSTISGGMLLRVDSKTAAEYSFFIAGPMMFAASFLELFEARNTLSSGDIDLFAIGFLTAFVVAYFSMKTFLKLLKKIPFSYFAYYRIVIAIIFYVVFVK